MLTKYNASPSLLLSIIYPEYNWLPWKFTLTPKNYWSEPKHQRKYMDWLENELGIKDKNDWYKVKIQVFETLRLENNLNKGYFQFPW